MTASALTTIIDEVAAEHGVTAADLCSPNHARRLVHPRQDAMWRMRQLLKEDGSPRFSFPQIGAALNRDHTTAIFGVRRHGERVAVPVGPTCPQAKPQSVERRQITLAPAGEAVRG